MTQDLMKLVDAYAGYNYGSAVSKEARAAVVAALEGVSSVHTPDLMAAAKLALDTLRGYEASIKQFGLLFGNGTKAIEALKKAGVK